MKDIIIESNGLVIYCKSLRLNSSDENMVILCDLSGKSIGCLYIDEVFLKYIRKNEIGKHYKVVSKLKVRS